MEAGAPLTEQEPHTQAEQELRPGSDPGSGSGGDPRAGGASGGSSPGVPNLPELRPQSRIQTWETRVQESRAGRLGDPGGARLAGAQRELCRGPGSKGSRAGEEEREWQRGREADCAEEGSDRDAGQAERPQRQSGVCVTEASKETGGSILKSVKKPPPKCQQEELLDSLARSSEVEEGSDRSDSDVEGEVAVLVRYIPAGDSSEEEEEEEEEQLANDTEPHQWKKTSASAQTALLFRDWDDQSLPLPRSAPLSPSQYFRQYFSWELWKDVAQQSSSTQAGGDAGRISTRDVCVFIGASIVMGTLKLVSWCGEDGVPLSAGQRLRDPPHAARMEPVSVKEEVLDEETQLVLIKEEDVKDEDPVPVKRERGEEEESARNPHLSSPSPPPPPQWHCLARPDPFSKDLNPRRHDDGRDPGGSLAGVDSLFPCRQCQRSFSSSWELTGHQCGGSDTEKVHFKCPVCGDRFERPTAFIMHKRSHVGQSRYVCTECGRTWKTLKRLLAHRHSHAGDRPHQCEECGHRFKRAGALQRHRRGHRGTRERAEEEEEEGEGGGGGGGCRRGRAAWLIPRTAV
ncbi:zinc finger and BTB domain-containing protein 7C-like [Polyodon spathula]|uniref:zinc finger and BTB domain-containing protein 7C-like n=1 Tax=Polyodon spathula TaxID=7913 RepID=UPI001B7F285D|nr:zinc finger and BTB domain-containing protein 7C-like [Polyodon spathula]